MIDNKKYFTKNLLRWNMHSNKRSMPWKGEKDPFKIWLSEIILQQTRVEQGLEYYNRFVESFPNIVALATTHETKIFKLWEGLGYYSRCKNLIATARTISSEYNGKFPEKYEQILALKGIGPYTAAAIASFAYNLPHAVVDGNVTRVLSRYFGIKEPIDSSKGKKLFTALAEELLDKKSPGVYNQALMDLGATVCKPANPLCNLCPLKAKCSAYLNNTVNELPVKQKALVKKNRWIYYLVAEHNGKVLVRKRSAGDIWENLYEFVRVESIKPISLGELKKLKPFGRSLNDVSITVNNISKEYRQQLSHQSIHGQFVFAKLNSPLKMKDHEAVTLKQLKKLPFPRFINSYLSENSLG
jgi:A/G-specific adenine glycosylase